MRHINFLLSFLLLSTFGCKKDKPIETQQPQIQIQTSEMTDTRDGQHYKIVKIGNQWWMAENLNYYTQSGSWYYNNDSTTYSKPYGRLYLWNTVMVGHASSNSNPSNVQGISPSGWHIPSVGEWKQLESYLSEFNYAGNELKETGTVHWKPSNTGTNTAMFNAVPAGTVYNNGNSFANINGYTTFLSSTIDTATGGVWGFGLSFDKTVISQNPLGLLNGWSLRCVKD